MEVLCFSSYQNGLQKRYIVDIPLASGSQCSFDFEDQSYSHRPKWPGY